MELFCLMQQEQKERVRGGGRIVNRYVVDEEIHQEGSTESLTRQNHAFEAVRCRGSPATVVRHYQCRWTGNGGRWASVQRHGCQLHRAILS